ncbi:hypothetical protein [Streptomyces sp. Ag109_G2-15]|uniref:hypothetical protein n=1 Tax=Streptomyces sp. Ag109_G2-15 TaxID=1938850 RepID=UPI000BDC22C9|nr:hypothetical protein [Streptomyces sp. Ag109_G2-15]SOD82738.1 hypothetical protein SAMN06272765_0692 [Streptomyces sp. Ag109_G2-15]
MQNLLLAMDDTAGTGSAEVEPALAVPFSEALADYADDTDQILTSVNVDYIRAETSSTSPWQDEAGVHMSVSVDSLLHVVRAISHSPPHTPQCGRPPPGTSRPTSRRPPAAPGRTR